MAQSSMWYASTLKRKTGLKRKTPLRAIRQTLKSGEPNWFKPKKPMRKQSRKQRARLAEYAPIRKSYLEENEWCVICPVRGLPQARATEVHHIRGRNGSLLFDTRFFAASCFGCREWPHEHKKAARDLGLLAPASEYGVPPKD